MAKAKSIDFDSGTSRIFNGNNFQGTAVVYAASLDDHTSFQCDFSIETLAETWPGQVRAQHLLRGKSGKPVPKVRSDQLGHELMIVFGPKVPANDAVAALERLAREIQKNGLLVGRDEAGDFLVETAGPTPGLIR